MNRDDIIRMAQEAGLETHPRKGEVRIGSAIITGCDSTEQVMRFANLVAAAEREACAKVIERDCHDDMTRAEEAAAIRARGLK